MVSAISNGWSLLTGAGALLSLAGKAGYMEVDKRFLPIIDSLDYPFLFGMILTATTTPLSVKVISSIARSIFSNQNLTRLEGSSLLHIVGILAILCKLPQIRKDFYSKDGSFSAGMKSVILWAVLTPIGLHCISKALRIFRDCLQAKLL